MGPQWLANPKEVELDSLIVSTSLTETPNNLILSLLGKSSCLRKLEGIIAYISSIFI